MRGGEDDDEKGSEEGIGQGGGRRTGMRRTRPHQPPQIVASRIDHDRGIWDFSASGGPQRAPGPTKKDARREADPGFLFGRSAGPRCEKSQRRMAGSYAREHGDLTRWLYARCD